MAEKIVITGGTGLIGSHVTATLLEAGHNVTALARTKRFSVQDVLTKEQVQSVQIVQGDMCDPEIVSELVNSADVIFHKAANQGIFTTVDNAQEFLQTNIGSAANLVDALKKAKKRPRLIVLDSSISVYGEGVYSCAKCGLVRPRLRYHKPGVNSDGMVQWEPLCPKCGGLAEPVGTPEYAERFGESVYAVAKKAQEDLLAGAANLFGISFVSLRYCTIIGAGQSWHSPFTRFLDLLSVSESPVLHEDGLQTRDFIFLDDVVQANMLALAKAPAGVSFYNVGSGKQSTLLALTKRLATIMSEELGTKTVDAFIDSQFVPGDVRHCHAQCDRIREDLGFVTKMDFGNELNKLVQWYLRKKGVGLSRT